MQKNNATTVQAMWFPDFARIFRQVSRVKFAYPRGRVVQKVNTASVFKTNFR